MIDAYGGTYPLVTNLPITAVKIKYFPDSIAMFLAC